MRRRASAPPPFVTADALHSAAIHLLRQLRRRDAAMGLTPARASALSVIVFGGPISLGRLADAEQVRPPTMTRLVAGLERDGLIVREPDPDDARVVRVRATPAGARVLWRGRSQRVRLLAARLKRLSVDEISLLQRAATLMERVARDEG